MIECMSNPTEQSRNLAQAGMPPAQAEAVAKAIHDLVDPLARKVEAGMPLHPEALKELRGDMARLGDRLQDSIDKQGERLQGNIDKQGERIDKQGERIDKQGERIDKLAESMSKANKELQGNIGRLVESTHKAHIEQIAATNDSHSKIVNKISDLGADLAETKGVFRGAKWVMVGILVAVASAAVKYIFFPFW